MVLVGMIQQSRKNYWGRKKEIKELVELQPQAFLVLARVSCTSEGVSSNWEHHQFICSHRGGLSRWPLIPARQVEWEASVEDLFRLVPYSQEDRKPGQQLRARMERGGALVV